MVENSSAALLEIEYLSQGDGLITLDDAKGYQWLDLIQTLIIFIGCYQPVWLVDNSQGPETAGQE